MKLMSKACFVLIISVVVTALQGAEVASFAYSRAQLSDAAALDELMKTEGVFDGDKIVILPHKFRKPSIEGAIVKGRLFVATHQDMIVGSKKLFVVEDPTELEALLTQEIRCKEGTLVDSCAFIRKDQDFYEEQKSLLSSSSIPQEKALYIYDGADFTKADYRGKGINHHLTTYAFESSKNQIAQLIDAHKPQYLILVYGLTHLNDYDDEGKGKSRTPHILSSFALFVYSLTGSYPEVIEHARYKSFMPTFDLDAEECVPKGDSESISGYGNVLVIKLH